MESSLSIKTATQLAIYIGNRPGTLAAACDALAKAGINIEALATEGSSSGPQSDELVRMVVDDPNKAVAVLEQVGAMAIQTDVLVIEGSNKPGLVARIADRLAKADINIESIFLSAGSSAESCVVILRPSNVEQAMRTLSDL